MTVSKFNSTGVTTMPKQKISDSRKTEAWGKQCVEAIQGMSNRGGRNGRSDKVRKQGNYDLYNSIIDNREVSHALEASTISAQYGDMPARMQCYNQIRGDIQALLGEEVKRPFNFMVVGESGEVIKAKEEIKKNAIYESLVSHLLIELGYGAEIDPQTGQQIPPQDPIEAAKYKEKNYKDIREICANQLLEVLIRRENLQMKFMEGFEHAFISSEEIYYIGISGGQPRVRVVNPLYFTFDKDSETKFIQDGQWAKEERWMTLGSVIDQYGEYLTDREIDQLEDGTSNGINNFGFGFQNVGPFQSVTKSGDVVNESQMGGIFGYDMNGVGSDHIYVCDVVWVSLKEIGFLKYMDENDQLQELTVSGDFKLTKEQKELGWELEFQWKREVWRGTRIGADIYCNITPLPNQINGQLPYVGYIYNNLNTTAMSLVDLLKPHQYLYNILWYRMELEIAKSGGKVMVMDMAKLPKGHTVDQFLYYVKSHGMAFINSSEEGSEPGKVVNYNNFISSLDLSMSNIISQYLMIMGRLEEQMAELSGVSRQRKGQITSSETVGGIETAIVSSSNTTEPYFFKHNEVKKAVLEQLLAVGQLAYIEGGTLQNVVDDVYSEVIKIDGDLINDSQFKLHISNSSKDLQIKNKLEAQAQAAQQNGLLKFSDIITVIKSSSINEISSIVRQSENEKQDRDQANMEADREAQLQASQNQLQVQREALIFNAEQQQLDRENKLSIAQIQALGFNENKDFNNDGQLDVLGMGKLALDQSKAAFQQSVEYSKQERENQKISLETQKAASEHELKLQELAIKNKQIDTSLAIAKQNKNRFDSKSKKK